MLPIIVTNLRRDILFLLWTALKRHNILKRYRKLNYHRPISTWMGWCESRCWKSFSPSTILGTLIFWDEYIISTFKKNKHAIYTSNAKTRYSLGPHDVQTGERHHLRLGVKTCRVSFPSGARGAHVQHQHRIVLYSLVLLYLSGPECANSGEATVPLIVRHSKIRWKKVTSLSFHKVESEG